MAFNIRDEFLQIPPITRIYTSACVLTTVAVVSFAIALYVVQVRESGVNDGNLRHPKFNYLWLNTELLVRISCSTSP